MTSSLPRVNTQFLPLVLQGHDRALTAVRYNNDGDLLFSSSKDKTPAVWYSETGEMIGTYGPHFGTVWDIDPSWDSQYVVTACSDAYARLFETTTGKYIAKCPHKGPVRSCAWSDSGYRFVTASDPFSGSKSREWGAVNIYDFPAADSLFESPTSNAGDPAPLHSAKFEIEILEMNKATSLTWTYNDEFIIAGFDNGMLIKYDAAVGKEVTRTTKLHSERINSINWNKDKTLFVTASKDCYAKVIDPYTFEVVKEIKTERPVNGAVFSPTHPHIILGGGQDAQTVTTTSSSQSGFSSRFYHMVYGEEFGRVKGHFGPINTMSIHPFGKSYCTGSEDGFIRVMPFDLTYLNCPDQLPDEVRAEIMGPK